MVSWEQLLIAPGSSGSVCSCRLSQATQSWARAHMAWKAPGHIEGLWMRKLIDLFHLTSAKRTKWGCVTCMLMPVVPSPPLPEPNPRGGETTVHAKGNSPHRPPRCLMPVQVQAITPKGSQHCKRLLHQDLAGPQFPQGELDFIYVCLRTTHFLSP